MSCPQDRRSYYLFFTTCFLILHECVAVYAVKLAWGVAVYAESVVLEYSCLCVEDSPESPRSVENFVKRELTGEVTPRLVGQPGGLGTLPLPRTHLGLAGLSVAICEPGKAI